MNLNTDPKYTAGVDGPATGTLRLLATTDLHAHLLPYDYTNDTSAPGTGLAGIATLIEQARTEAREEGAACILVDNGDILQGTPLADLLATRPVGRDHAIAASLATLRYDAIGIGNHDFDYGLPYLRDVAQQLGAPVVCSNLHGVPLDPILSHLVITCTLPDNDGTRQHQLKVGILSVLPALTSVWNRHTLGPDARVEPSVDCLRRSVTELRQSGAELIVVLAHMGMGDHEDVDTAQAGALALREVAGVDVLITGHTHRRLPGADYVGREGIDAASGRVGKIPAIMAGHAGSDLGVLDLKLERKHDNTWSVTGHASVLRPNTAATLPHPAILRCANAADAATRAHFSEKIATTSRPLHSYFALVTAAPTTRLLAEAKARCVRRAIVETPYAELPLLAASAAHTAGGRAGPQHYINIPEGPILRRHIAGLSPYANTIVGLLTTGHELRDRLEFAARIFSRIGPDQPEQPLINIRVPGFHFDTVFGVSYQIDPSAPAGARIRDLRYQGQPVRSDQQFVLATNQFRAAGGGGYVPSAPNQIIARSSVPVSETLIEHLRAPKPEPWHEDAPWRFAPLHGMQATFDTALEAAGCLEDISHLAPEVRDRTADGFLQLRVTL